MHPGAAQTLLDTVLELTDPRPGESALDLYCGVGLFSAFLAPKVGRCIGVGAVQVADGRKAIAGANLARWTEKKVLTLRTLASWVNRRCTSAW